MTTWAATNKAAAPTWAATSRSRISTEVDFLFSDGTDFLFSDSADYVFFTGTVADNTWAGVAKNDTTWAAANKS